MASQTTINDYLDKQRRRLGGSETLTRRDVLAFDSAKWRVFELLNDGLFHSAEEVIAAAGQREGLRRLRELRRYFRIETRRAEGKKREFCYRMLRP